MISVTNRLQMARDITQAYEDAHDCWQGCDWTTSFGALGLNLDGMKPHQTRLLAGATSGQEALHWYQASAWLAQVACDAGQAQRNATDAVSLWQAGQRMLAFGKIEAAVAVEAKYRNPVTWQPLFAAIQAAIERPSTGPPIAFAQNAEDRSAAAVK